MMNFFRWLPVVASAFLVPFAWSNPTEKTESCAELMMFHFFPESRVKDVIWYEGSHPPVHFGRIQARLREVQKDITLERNSYSRSLARLTKSKEGIQKELESLSESMKPGTEPSPDLLASLKKLRMRLFSIEGFQNAVILRHLERGQNFELQLSAIYIKLSQIESRFGIARTREFRANAVISMNNAELFRRELEARIRAARLQDE